MNVQKNTKKLDVRLKKVRRKEISTWNQAKRKVK